MAKLFPRKPKTDPAGERYPGAMAGLLSLGETVSDASYDEWADRLGDYAADLVRMVQDEDLNERESDDPAVWAPIHALRILARLGPEEAAEPLLECMDLDSDWFEEELPPVYGAIGPAAIPMLRAYMEDPSHDQWGRGRAATSLRRIAEAHPEAYDEVVGILARFLDRPGADAGSEEEILSGSVIAELADLKATAAHEAIRRAFHEDRVDTTMVGLAEVERDLGLEPSPDFDEVQPVGGPGVRLVLKCKACGRERNYLFPKVYYDLGTSKDKQKSAKYSPLVIPQRVVCPKCGAVDQYEPTGMTYIALTASALKAAGQLRATGSLPDDMGVQYITFTSRWGEMHPQEAIERYRQELARKPDDVSLHVGFGNVLRFIGRYGEADTEYHTAVRLDPDEPEAWINLAQLAGLAQDIPTAIRCWERVEALANHPGLPPDQRQTLAEAAAESLAELRQGNIPEFDALLPEPEAAPARPGAVKLGRNDPCWCGSGKKYKRCHMAADRQARVSP